MSKLWKQFRAHHGYPKYRALKHAERKEAKREDALPDLLMPDDEALQMEALRKAARRTGGRQSTILTGRIGGPAAIARSALPVPGRGPSRDINPPRGRGQRP